LRGFRRRGWRVLPMIVELTTRPALSRSTGTATTSHQGS
jgi:hypothetical protein